jgi:hypothetical protein
MAKPIDFVNVSTSGLEKSKFAAQLAGVRANEARYFKNKYDHDFVTKPAEKAATLIKRMNKALAERDIVVSSEPLEAADFITENIRWTYVFYQSGLSLNIMYTLDEPKKRAVGIKLCEDMEIPKEFADKFKFARQKSKLAGVIRGSYFVLKNEY